MRYMLIFTIFTFSYFTLNGQNHSKPSSIEDAVLKLTKILPDSIQQKVLSMTEDEFLANAHHGLGMWIRNNWIYWGNRQLKKHFDSLEIYQADDKSGIILRCYYRQIHNQDWELEKQIEFYQNYGKAVQDFFNRLETDTAFARQTQINIEASMRDGHERLKKEFPIGSLVKTYVLYSWFGSSQVIGEVIDWRVVVSKDGEMGIMPEGYKVPYEYLEAKLRVVEYVEMKKKKKIERYINKNNNELWERVDGLRKVE